jgi:3-hydroxybutyryl-CoA dehydrogenase
MSAVNVVGVVGAGQMGGGIAEVCARAGVSVRLFDVDEDVVSRGLARIDKSLGRAERSGRVTAAERAEALGRITSATDLDALADAGLVVEAVVEDEEVKLDVFRRLDGVVADPDAVLASNTSSIPIMRLAAVTESPERVIGMHFFNPVPVLKLVEVIRAVQTSDETAAAIVRLARELGKEPAEANDYPGFVSNRILMPFINEAAYALLEGVAEAEAIDTIARLGFAHPLGPLALADLIGLDTCVAIMEVLQSGLGDPKYAPCPLLRQYVQAGRLGRKSGRGFYAY